VRSKKRIFTRLITALIVLIAAAMLFIILDKPSPSDNLDDIATPPPTEQVTSTPTPIPTPMPSPEPIIYINSTVTEIPVIVEDGICYLAAVPMLEKLGVAVFWNAAEQTLATNSKRGELALHRANTTIVALDKMEIGGVNTSITIDGTIYLPLNIAAILGGTDIAAARGNAVHLEKADTGYATDTIQRVMEQIPLLENYNPLNFPQYIEYAEANPETDANLVVLYVNIGVHKEHYSDIQTIENPHDVFAVLDKNHRVPDDFEPEVVLHNGAWWIEEVGLAWDEMKAAAARDGVSLTLNRAYRSIADQRNNYNSKVNSGRSVAEVDKGNSRPGHSEHHTGYAADISPINGEPNTPSYVWLAKHAHEYGFIISFTAEKRFITGYIPEPWHIRWFPQWAADIMHSENLTIPEFDNLYLNPAKHGYAIDHVHALAVVGG